MLINCLAFYEITKVQQQNTFKIYIYVIVISRLPKYSGISSKEFFFFNLKVSKFYRFKNHISTEWLLSLFLSLSL